MSHSTPDTQFRVGSSLQAGLYARTPVQSDRCALSGNYRLESNPIDVQMRHWQVEALVRLHWKDRFGDMSRTRLLPRFRNLPVNEPSKNHLAGWFSFHTLQLC
ncbi:hypothetical protein FFY37_28380 (plasmid) [Klebsiella pneumoniae]|nr:hypothetical protein FFY37_28380 [Klebsiella pneumoniae]